MSLIRVDDLFEIWFSRKKKTSFIVPLRILTCYITYSIPKNPISPSKTAVILRDPKTPLRNTGSFTLTLESPTGDSFIVGFLESTFDGFFDFFDLHGQLDVHVFGSKDLYLSKKMAGTYKSPNRQGTIIGHVRFTGCAINNYQRTINSFNGRLDITWMLRLQKTEILPLRCSGNSPDIQLVLSCARCFFQQQQAGDMFFREDSFMMKWFCHPSMENICNTYNSNWIVFFSYFFSSRELGKNNSHVWRHNIFPMGWFNQLNQLI